MRLSVVAFSKVKTPGLRETADYYLKLLRPYVTAEEIELKPIPVPEKSAAIRKQIQQKEGELLLQKLSTLHGGTGGRRCYYLLDERGAAKNTQDWAQMVRDWEQGSVGHVSLCIGSSLGFSDEVRKQARGLLSLGPQTLPHELARVVLLEQLYRSWSVTRGHPYHNEGT